MNQRWRDRLSRFRPAGEVLDPAAYTVRPLAGDSLARAFVARHHYSGTYPAARFRCGLYRGAELAGVAVFSVPVQASVLTRVFPGDPAASVELGRFVLLDDVPGNGETWFLARCFQQLRAAGIRGVVSFSDPVPRHRADGAVVFPGHVGTIYQAHNGVYLGRGTPRTLRLLPDGRAFSARAAQKIRARERGWEYAARQLEAWGAPPLDADADADAAAWLRAWLPRLTQPLRHPGCHKYAWALDRAPSARRVSLPAAPAIPG